MRLTPSDVAALPPRIRAQIAAHYDKQTKAAMPAPPALTEADLHKQIVAMFAAIIRPGCIVFHPANGEARSKGSAGKLKAMGVVPGIFDLIILADGKAFGLEIKTPTGRMSPAQKTMAQRFDRAGVPWIVVRSLSAARKALEQWKLIAE